MTSLQTPLTSVERMILCRAPNVLGPQRLALRASALEQRFHAKDPREDPRDDGIRPGFREAGVCYESDGWEGFGRFLDVAGPTLTGLIRDLQVPVRDDVRPVDIQLTKSVEGGFFGRHTDAGYMKDEHGRHLPLASFVYYLGDRDSFDGGELSFDGLTLEPTDDLLVVFRGDRWAHAVLPVRGANALRLTINGYFA